MTSATTRLVPTLPRSAYLSDDEFAAERDQLFARQWCATARADDIAAGDALRVSVGGESVMLVRDDEGVLRGFYNVCRHRGAELLDATGPATCRVGQQIRCPYHGWTYRLDGSLRGAPFLDDPAIDEATIQLHPVAVDTWGGFVFVNLTPATAQPLAEQLSTVVGRAANYPLAELRRGLTYTYDVAANWKVLAENYNECYHCGPVHPELCELVPDFRRAGGNGLDWADGIPHREGAWTFTTTGTSTRLPFATLDEAERVRHKGELVYPNLMVSLSAEHVAAYTLNALAPGRTKVVCDLLFHPDEIASPGFDPSDAGDLWHLVNQQDWAICESVQRGMSSRAWTGGWFAPMEVDSANIADWYRRTMGEA